MPGDAQGIGVPLNLFGGMVTELSAPSLPEGVSPDCQDVVFLPGSVANRPCLAKLFAAAFPNTVTMVYQKTFVQPNEDPLNLFIDSVNKLWVEDTGSAPGVATLFATLPYNSGTILQAISCTQFGREYIACSDGAHGAAVPLQFDGTNLDRVTQDGPGAPIVAGDENISQAIAASPNGLLPTGSPFNITSATEVGFLVTLIINGLTALQTANVLSSFQANDLWQIAGVGAGYNGTWQILTCVSSGISQLTITYYSTANGLGSVFGAGTAANSYYTVIDAAGTVQPTVGVNVAIAGAGVPGYIGTWPCRFLNAPGQFTVYIANTFGLAASGNGTWAIAGSVSAGQHQVVVMFLTRQGYVTKPSPSFSWTAAGGKRAIFSNLPIGPANVVARIIALTGAGGANYFYIPATFTLPGTTSTVYATVVNDNSSTSATVDFSDNALFAATAIDIPGRNYFAQVVLSDCLGVFPFASRMFWWGERNKVQNFLNMGFEGGMLTGVPTVPLGWTVVTAGGFVTTVGAWASGFGWAITGDGTANPKGQISQPASRDNLGIAILQPSTKYTFRCWIAATVNFPAGNFVAEFFSASAGSLATATFSLATATIQGGYFQANFTVATPAVIPADAVFRFSVNNVANGVQIITDECQVIPTLNPYRDSVFRASYVNAPEQMDGVTGVLGSTSDPSAIRNAFQIRNTMYFHTLNGLSSTTDTGTSEPSKWNVPEVTQSVGSRSVHGTDAGKVGTGESGEQLEFVANENGVYIFNGGETLKISQEIQAQASNGMPGWDSINKAAIQTLWIKNDIPNRRLYIGAPTGTATAPNILFVMDYRELNDFAAIAGNGPTRESLQGRMIAKEFCRKWTRWNITANCGEILARAGGVQTFCLGAGNGFTPFSAPGFGNVYSLSFSKLTDDDYGQVTPYYTTYFFVSRDQEQQLQLDVHRKLATYLSAFITGTGQTTITPLADVLSNPWPALPAYPLSASQNHDFEWGMNVSGERVALKIGSIPLLGQTDNGFNLQHLAMTLKKEPMSPIRGAI